MAEDEEIDEILEGAQRMLRAAHAGLKQFQETEGEDRILGLYNAVTFGRNVTFVLQNLKGKADGFEEWYEERVEILKEDPVCSHMKELRNEIVKEGSEGVSTYASASINSADLWEKAPPWADTIFIGDQYGGSGFSVEKADGTEVKFYYDFPDENIETGLYFPELEENERGWEMPNDAEEDLKYYVKILAELVRDAEEEFGNSED